MRPIVVTQTGVGASAAQPVDYSAPGFTIGLACVISGTPTYKVQHTFDNVMDSSVTPTWFDHDVLVGVTTNADGNYSHPVRALRVNVTAVAVGTDAVTMTILQGADR